MNIILLNKPQLDDFSCSQKHSQFLQSWDWGDFQKSIGQPVWRLGVTLDRQIIASAQILQYLLPLNKSYLYCPRGPVMENSLPKDYQIKILQLILSKVRDLTIATAQTEEIFFRLEPTNNLSIFQSSNLIATKSIQPADTLILDLTQPEEQLLMNMRHKTRYNIRLAQRHGITIKKINLADFTKVWPLFEQTAKRDTFKLHPKNYYLKMLETVSWVQLWAAEYKGEIIAASFISLFGDTAYYLHGASSYSHRSLMAPYLLHWEIILNAKAQNCHYFDFYGVAPSDDPNHRWAGITRYKKGFGGQVINLPGTFDFVYQPTTYKIYQLLRKMNLLLRRR